MSTRFNTINVSIPAQKFDITCHVSIERSVPVMTEFAIRLLRTVGKMSLEQIRDYLGLDNHGVRELIGILKAENLIDENSDILSLSAYAETRFDSSTDEIPRFTTIAERRRHVTFELLTFQHIPRDISYGNSSYALELKLPESEQYENTIEQAEKAYIDQFHDIEKLSTLDEQKRAFGVYKIDEISANKRFNLPYVVHFEIDISGQVEQVFDEQLKLSPELKDRLESSVSDTVHSLKLIGKDAIAGFAREFKDDLIRSFIKADGFSLSDYFSAVHATKNNKYISEDLLPFFGAVYLPDNTLNICNLLKSALSKFREDNKGVHVKPTMYWLAPTVELWGRTKLLGNALEEIKSTGRTALSNNKFTVKVIRQQSSKFTKRELNPNADAGVLDLLFCEPDTINSRYELLVLPGIIAIALCHVPIPSTVGSAVPIGFSTTNSEQIKLIENMLFATATKAHSYYKRESRDDKFEQADISSVEFQTLHISSLKLNADENLFKI